MAEDVAEVAWSENETSCMQAIKLFNLCNPVLSSHIVTIKGMIA